MTRREAIQDLSNPLLSLERQRAAGESLADLHGNEPEHTSAIIALIRSARKDSPATIVIQLSWQDAPTATSARVTRTTSKTAS